MNLIYKYKVLRIYAFTHLRILMSFVSLVIREEKAPKKAPEEKTNIVSVIEKLNFKYIFKSLKKDRKIDNETAYFIDENFDFIERVEGLKTNLYTHQKYAIKAMLDLEKYRTIKNKNAEKKIIKYNAAVLSDPPGLGKTIYILSLVLLSKIPRAIPDIVALDSHGFIRRKFKKIFPTTIIFVGISVMNQWKEAIKKFTDLKFYPVEKVQDLRKLIAMMNRGTLPYDVILVKNGKITAEVEIPGFEYEKKFCSHIYNIFCYLHNYCFARIIIDDFDTIGIPLNAGIVNGLFTWYISATRKFSARSVEREFTSYTDYYKYPGMGSCCKIYTNDFMFKVLNVRCNPAFITRLNEMVGPKYYMSSVSSGRDVLVQMIDMFGEHKSLVDMLNADAIDGAAASLGIKSATVGDIFEKILSNKLEDYKYYDALVEFIDYNIPRIEHLPEPPAEIRDISDAHSKTGYGRRELKKFTEINYKYENIGELLVECRREYIESRDSISQVITRIKSNLSDGECPVCYVEFKQNIINKCCGFILCCECGIKLQKIGTSVAHCANCRAPLKPTDLIYMGADIDIKELLAADITTAIENNAPTDAPNAEIPNVDQNNFDEVPNEKYRIMLKIITGQKYERKQVNMNIRNLAVGFKKLPVAEVKKILIFANFDETLVQCKQFLDKYKIKFHMLNGTPNQIAALVKNFEESKEREILLINAVRYCSGLNLQMSTDVIFMHAITDMNIETQLIGRAIRLGRVYALDIHYILYTNEVATMSRNHSMLISESE